METLVLYSADASLDAQEFETILNGELEKDIWPDEILVLLRHDPSDPVQGQIATKRRLRASLGRAHDRIAVTFSTFGPDGQEVLSHPHRGTGCRLTYGELRRRMMTEVFVRRGGFVRSTPAYHFGNPSKRHTDRFMRLANALVRRAEISFLGFCCLPSIPESTRNCYVDTPALLGLVGAVNDHRSASGWRRVDADCFGSYEGLKSYGTLSSRDAVVLISASSSGGLARVVEEKGIPADQVVHVTYLGQEPSSYPVVCDLAYDKNNNPYGEKPAAGDWREGRCPLCERQSVAINLSGDQFEIPSPLPTPLMIIQADAPKGLDLLMGRLAGTGAFSVGLGAGYGRPKLMFVRTNALMASEAYLERLDYALSRAVPASVVAIVQLDESSAALVELIQAKIKSRVRVIRRTELDRLDADETTDAVLIVAAVIESGRSLQDISRELRSAFPKAPQSYVVGFAKAASVGRDQALRNSLTKTAAVAAHEFVKVETMILPPDPGATAWSRELEFWQRLQTGGAAFGIPAEVIARRVERLKDAAEPLSDDLFVQNADDLTLKLEHGFVFWPEGLPKRPHVQADVFFTISSVLQNLRQSETTRVLRASSIQHTLLAAGNFGRFNDSIIQASLLRAALPAEINYAADATSSNEMGRIARRIIENSTRTRGGAAAEILLALATARLTLCPGDRNFVLSRIEGLPPMVAGLMEACRATLIA
ncbi:hypothetical protein FS827_23590 [Agrobacterium vitis]|uniref:hypothetical protein n=1 Tax=Allorhizobium ampelinum TaxID=3025782 RepID=UPI001F444513|nr:hypothetical protein [Allorhizobium ampelinum]MCF1464284.1 hypothetical protein [Allorhizobium ampelinum]